MLGKALQRQVYDFFSTKYGLVLCVLGLLFSFSSVIQLVAVFLPANGAGNEAHAQSVGGFTIGPDYDADNIAGRSFREHLCSPLPIDIVYTWVNGSDPRLLKQLQEYKDEFLADEDDGTGRRLLADEDDGVGANAGNNYGVNEAADHGTGTGGSGGGSGGSESGDADDEETAEDKFNEYASASRFRDNNELRYSMRSIERFAPWVRKIFVVTNGQIPNWLDINHPRIEMVTHEDIFLNKSHLPTFSSPAIEAHLHRIPGLSPKFIYFNDDVLFGNEVWPSDFYTHAGGQKVYFAWAVPNCNEGCPASWINDGVCDQACNVSSCDYDGIDCVNVTANNRYNTWFGGYNNWNQANQHRYSTYCAPGCPDSWIGDRYCDKACTNEACGWDASDCGVELMRSSLYGVDLVDDMPVVHVPPLTPAMYVNLTAIFGHGRIVEGSHDNAQAVRTATISQRHKVMTLTFHKNVTLQNVMVSIMGTLQEGDEEAIELTFNITVDTLVMAGRTRNITHPTTAEEVDAAEVAAAYEALAAMANATANNGEANSGEGGSGDGATAGAAASARLLLSESGGDEPLEYSDEAEVVEVYPVRLTEPEALFPSIEGLEEEATAERDTSRDIEHDGWDAERTTQGMVTVRAHRNLPSDQFELLNLLMTPAAMSVEDEALWRWITATKQKLLAEEEKMAREDGDNRRGRRQRTAWDADGDYHPIPEDWMPSSMRWLADHHADHALEASTGEGGEGGDGVDTSGAGTGRKLLDVFGESLKYVNRLYNKAFGQLARKVPAHMPHMIDVKLMERLQARWPEEFARTSAHRVRDPSDMQFAFSYFYYLIHEEMEFSLQSFFEETIDVNQDGFLDHNELRTLAARTIGTPLARNDMASLVEILNTAQAEIDAAAAAERGDLYEVVDAAQSNGGGGGGGADDGGITPPELRGLWSFEALNRSVEIVESIEKHFGQEHRNRHEVRGVEEVSFEMIGDNDTDVLDQLDAIRESQNKFVCLNDNMNDTNRNEKVVAALQDFYESLLPMPCQFELPDGVYNEFLYVEDYRASLHATSRRGRVINFFWLGVFVTCCLLLGTSRGRDLISTGVSEYNRRADRRQRELRSKKLLQKV